MSDSNETQTLTTTDREQAWILANAKAYEELYTANAKSCRSLQEKLSSTPQQALNAVETGGLVGMVQDQITELKFKLQAYEKLTNQSGDPTKYLKYKMSARENLEMLSGLRSKLVQQTPHIGEKNELLQQQPE